MRTWIPALQVPEYTQVTLKRSDQVISISSVHMMFLILGGNPMKSTFILWHRPMEMDQLRRAVAGATPYTPAGCPTAAGSRKICTEDPAQVHPKTTTLETVTFPVPKRLW
jgi:hypothetical protein